MPPLPSQHIKSLLFAVTFVIILTVVTIFYFSKTDKDPTEDDLTVAPSTSSITEPENTTHTVVKSRTKRPKAVSKKLREADVVSFRSEKQEQAFILKVDPDEAQISTIKKLGARITPSKAGRTGQVLRIKNSEVITTKKTLEGTGIEFSGELLELFITIADHDHANCGSCLAESHSKIRAINGVISIPRYLGNAKKLEVDVVINPEKTSAVDIFQTFTSP